MPSKTTKIAVAPQRTSVQKTARQPIHTSRYPPITGAIIGASRMNISISDMARAIYVPENRSRMMARESTVPAAPPIAWKNRNIDRLSALVAVAQRTVITM